MSSSTHDADVLVVGLGPVGAALAAMLAQRSISVIAIDKEAEVYPLPRAVAFDHEIMRLFQGLGIAQEVLPHCRFSKTYEFINAAGEILLRYDRTAVPLTSGWPSNATFYQPGVERLLRGLIERAPNAKMLLGTRLVSLDCGDDQVSAVCESPGGTQKLTAKYVVGCDGGASKVRSEIGGKLRDFGFDEPWLVVDFRADNESGLPPTNTQFCDPSRPATFVRMGPGRHRWEVMLLPGEQAEQVLDETFIFNFLRARGFDTGAQIERKAVYRFHALIADSWKKGRVLLAGDSAHQMPPFAGQGMCSGLRDAANLAWKLEAVMRRGAKVSLLDTYQPEREPHVATIIKAAIAMGKVVCTTDPVVAAERDARLIADRDAGTKPISMVFPPLDRGCLLSGTPGAGEYFPQPWAEVGGETRRFDDVYAGNALLLSRRPVTVPAHSQSAALVTASLEDHRVRPFAEALSAWLHEHNAEAVLVRPDCYVFGTGRTEDLLAAYARQSGLPDLVG